VGDDVKARTVKLWVPGIPQPGGSKRGFVTKGGRVAIVEDAKRNKDWRATVALAASKAMGEEPPLTCALSLTIEFLFPRPKGHYGTGKNAGKVKPAAPWSHTTRPDLTKLIRSTEDALTRIVWLDDAQVYFQVAEKRYTSEQPGAWITVAPWDGCPSMLKRYEDGSYGPDVEYLHRGLI